MYYADNLTQLETIRGVCVNGEVTLTLRFSKILCIIGLFCLTYQTNPQSGVPFIQCNEHML